MEKGDAIWLDEVDRAASMALNSNDWDGAAELLGDLPMPEAAARRALMRMVSGFHPVAHTPEIARNINLMIRAAIGQKRIEVQPNKQSGETVLEWNGPDVEFRSLDNAYIHEPDLSIGPNEIGSYTAEIGETYRSDITPSKAAWCAILCNLKD